MKTFYKNIIYIWKYGSAPAKSSKDRTISFSIRIKYHFTSESVVKRYKKKTL